MAKSLIVTAAEANRSFSKLLREVQQGSRVTITSHGRPIAEIGPVQESDTEKQRRRKALEDLKAHWAKLEPTVVGPWTREELYDRDKR